jgi:hypothetical protein
MMAVPRLWAERPCEEMMGFATAQPSYLMSISPLERANRGATLSDATAARP